MRFTRDHILNKKYVAQLCRLPSNIGFPCTSNGLDMHRNSYSQMFFKSVVFKILESFTRNTCVGLFINKVTGPQACNLVKKKLQRRCFRVKFLIFSITFFTLQVRQLLLKTFINCNTKLFERSSVLQGGRDHTWNDSVHSI